ncbi:hypothetical protein PVK06_013162 [Gossypium arboreum]|uniref:Uncharacterized protein n=1 Tax=Gossypium arboreum TaxID=29729 RepID=A0ABR0QEJ8_GOSAR|nr:hypothetical protein PVK06_013162 [Gossypium arboreum]
MEGEVLDIIHWFGVMSSITALFCGYANPVDFLKSRFNSYESHSSYPFICLIDRQEEKGIGTKRVCKFQVISVHFIVHETKPFKVRDCPS